MATAGNTVHKIQKFSYTNANNTTVYNSDVKVQGNLTVVGSSVYAQSEVVLVKDNIITLNAAIGQSDTPLFNAGIEVDRGNQPNVSFIWNESSQAWQFTNNGTTYESLGGGSSGVYANAAFIQANAAFAVANTGSADVFARTQANASFIQANAAFNAANNASDTWVRNQANIAYTHANAAYAFANTTTTWSTRQAFKATAGQTIFSPGSGYLPGSIDVYYNGIKLYGAEDYTATDGINVTLTNPATVNSIIEIVGFGANVPVANVYVLNSMASIVQRQSFFATAGQTTFTVTGGYRIGYIDVYYNGLKINIPEDVTANNGSTINFVGLTPALNDIIEVVGLTPNVALANAIPITGGTISGGLTLAGNVNPVTDNTYYLGSATNRWHSIFVGPGSVDIGGLKLSNVAGTLSVSSPGQPATPIAGEDTWVRTQANASFLQANAAYNAANSVNVYGANTAANSFFAIPQGTTAERPVSAQLGSLRYNTTLGYVEVYTLSGWNATAGALPTITNVTPASYGGNTGASFTVFGTGFQQDASVRFVTANGAEYTAATVSYGNTTTLQVTTPRAFTVADGPLDVRVIQANGTASVTKFDTIQTGTSPTWNTASGTLATIYDTATGTHATINAYDPETSVTYSIDSGSLPAGTTLNSSTGAISGDPTDVESQTTSTFTAAATDTAGNQITRSFSIIVRPFLDGSTSAKAAGSPAQIASLLGSTPTNGVYWYKNSGYNSGTAFQVYTDWSINSNTGYMILTQSQISGAAITNFTDVGTLSTSVSGTRGHNNTFREPTATILTGWSGDTSNRCLVGQYRTSTGTSLSTASYLQWIQIAVTPSTFKLMFDNVPGGGEFTGTISARSAGGTGSFYWSKTNSEYSNHLQMGNALTDNGWNGSNYIEIRQAGGDTNHSYFVAGDGGGSYWAASLAYNGGSGDRVGFFGFAPNNFI